MESDQEVVMSGNVQAGQEIYSEEILVYCTCVDNECHVLRVNTNAVVWNDRIYRRLVHTADCIDGNNVTTIYKLDVGFNARQRSIDTLFKMISAANLNSIDTTDLKIDDYCCLLRMVKVIYSEDVPQWIKMLRMMCTTKVSWWVRDQFCSIASNPEAEIMDVVYAMREYEMLVKNGPFINKHHDDILRCVLYKLLCTGRCNCIAASVEGCLSFSPVLFSLVCDEQVDTTFMRGQKLTEGSVITLYCSSQYIRDMLGVMFISSDITFTFEYLAKSRSVVKTPTGSISMVITVPVTQWQIHSNMGGEELFSVDYRRGDLRGEVLLRIETEMQEPSEELMAKFLRTFALYEPERLTTRRTKAKVHKSLCNIFRSSGMVISDAVVSILRDVNNSQ